MENKRALIISTVSGFLPQFEMNHVKILMEYGYQVHYASNFLLPMYGEGNERLEGSGIECHQIDFVRTPYKLVKNIRAYSQLKKLRDSYHFSLIHCHTPMGAALGRLVFKGEQGAKIVYTAHGFHFYKKGPLKNWFFYYPIEKRLSRYTDVLITINREDFSLAWKKFKAKKVVYIPGVGISTNKIDKTVIERKKIRDILGVKDSDFVLISVGELNKNKNHKVILQALGRLKERRVHYLICGQGEQKERLIVLAKKLGIENQVHFLGYRTDVIELCKVSDCFVFPSKREGLGMAALEGMACKLPLISSDSGGIKDYSRDGKTGYRADCSDVDGFCKAIQKLMNNRKLCKTMGAYNRKLVKKFDIGRTEEIMRQVYKDIEK